MAATTMSAAASVPLALPGLRRSPGGSAALRSGPCPAAAARRAMRPTRKLAVRAEAEGTDAVPTEKSIPSLPAKLDIDEIMEILPHRYPFLLVDRVVELETQKYAIGYKNITVNDNFFPGHFPQRPLMPGVLQIEAMAQLGGIVMLDPEDTASKNNFFFGGIDGCKFRRPVVPGDTLMMKVELTKFNKRFGVAKMDAKGYVGDALAVEATLTLVMAPSS